MHETDPDQVLTIAELEALENEARLVMATPEELRWLRLTPKERGQAQAVQRLQDMAAFFTEHPELAPHVSFNTGAPAFLEVETVSPQDEGFDNWDEANAENERRKIKAQAQALRAVGLKIEKRYGDDGDLTIIATPRGLDFEIRGYAYGYCQYVEGPKERVEVVEVPDEVKKSYTRIELVPKQERICVPLMTRGEMEDV